jgi:NAD(P)-dependent dehydrogenase (short-subunit alcohol dehydrogenase family)
VKRLLRAVLKKVNMTSLLQAHRKVDLNGIPDLQGKTYLVTGANVGIGYEIARALAARNAKLYMASRNPERQERAIQQIKEEFPHAQLDYVNIDMTSMQSVYECSEQLKKKTDRLDCLINNIGTGNPPDVKTEDGMDPTMSTNYFGMFLLTHLLLDTLRKQDNARIVNMGSLTEPHGKPEWDDLTGSTAERSDYTQYCNSKLFVLMFTAELQRRLKASGSNIDVFAAHPGVSLTDAFRKSDKSKPVAKALTQGAQLIGQSAAGGAQSVIKCATDPELTGRGGMEQHWGAWYGGLPIRPFGQAWPILVATANIGTEGSREPINPYVKDPEACRRLYEDSIRIVNEKIPVQIQPADEETSGNALKDDAVNASYTAAETL